MRLLPPPGSVLALLALTAGCGTVADKDPVDAPNIDRAVGETGSRPDTEGDADTDADTDTDTDIDTDTAPSGDTDTASGGDTDTASGGDTDTASGGDTDTASGGDTDTSAPVDTAPGGDPPDTGPGTSDPDTGADTSSDTGSAPRDTGPLTSDPGATDTGTSTPDTATSPADTAAPGSGGGDTAGSAETGGGSADTATGSGKGESVGAGTGDTASDSGADTGADTGSGSSSVLRFVAIGDAGTGASGQYDVAAGIATVCAREGCDFALYLGDNIYPDGVTSVTDAQWDSKFQLPYAALSFPFYAILGNHDYGGHSFDVSLAQAQIDYTAYATNWIMQDFYWTQEFGDTAFVGIDTMAIYEGYGADQETWIASELAALSSTWKIVIGHHPYLSNGPHGNAGEYEGVAGEGVEVQDFIDTYVCGVADVYLCGHDHSLQWIEETCGTQFIVSGSGSSPSGLTGANPVYFEDASLGFLWVEIDGRSFTGVFYDETGTELYRATITK